MEKLNSYLIYNLDSIDLSELFNNLSKQLKLLHSYDKVVPNLSGETILCDEQGFSFDGMADSNNLEVDKRSNLLSLGKLLLGYYLTKSGTLSDLSSVDDNWFIQKVDSICDTITDDSFNGDYFSSLFNGSNEYYSDYLDRIKQNEALGGKGNVRTYKKVLSNATSELYDDQSEEQIMKDASISGVFYPLLIGLSLIVAMSIFFVIKFV